MKYKKSIPSIAISLFLLSLNSHASCDNCSVVNGEKVHLAEVATSLGDYDYVRLTDNRKVTIPYQFMPQMTIALALGLTVYIHQGNNNYVIYNE